MFRNLKLQLLVSGIAAIALLLLGIWAASAGRAVWAILIMVVLCVYIILLNLWFWRYVTDPIALLTDFARRIAAGSYGSRLEESNDNEIGRLTDEINNMSEKVAIA